MSALSIRKLPTDLHRAIEREAKEQGKSKSEVVVSALRKSFGLEDAEQRQRRERLMTFFGKLSQADYAKFKSATECFENIDEDMWRDG